MTRVDLIAAAIRVIGPRTSLYRQPSGFELFIDTIIENEPKDVRMARQIDAEITKAVDAVKRIKTNREFKKIIQHAK